MKQTDLLLTMLSLAGGGIYPHYNIRPKPTYKPISKGFVDLGRAKVEAWQLADLYERPIVVLKLKGRYFLSEVVVGAAVVGIYWPGE